VGRVRSGNSERRVSAEVTPLMTFTLGTGELAAWAGADDVTPSSRRLFLQSTRMPKWDTKSAPMRGCAWREANHHLQLAPESRIRGSIRPLPHTSWRSA
jgi:hypothetical protein